MSAPSEVMVDRIDPSERIAALDVIRGIAILFILFMNIPGMLALGPTVRDPRIVSWTGADQAAFSGMFVYLNGTQRGLLELLFGAGIMIMARRAMMPDGPVETADLHYRRNLLLIALGLFNALVLLWWGDILLPYGIAAVFLFPFRTLKPRTQLLWSAVFLASVVASGVHLYNERAAARVAAVQMAAATAAHKPVAEETKARAEAWQKAVSNALPIDRSPKKQEAYAKMRADHLGPVQTYVAANWKDWLDFFQPDEFFLVEAEILATMLLGMALFQFGVIQGRARTSVYVGLLVVGYGLGIPLRIQGLQEIFLFSPMPKVYWLHADVTRLLVTLGHLAAIHLALRSRAGRSLLAPFQAAGRMPLSTYLFTSFVMMWVLAPGFGFGIYGHWGFAAMMSAAGLIIVAEVILTNLWMRSHETGPMEWLWKSLAYRRRQAFRLRAPVAPAVTVPV